MSVSMGIQIAIELDGLEVPKMVSENGYWASNAAI